MYSDIFNVLKVVAFAIYISFPTVLSIHVPGYLPVYSIIFWQGYVLTIMLYTVCYPLYCSIDGGPMISIKATHLMIIVL